MDADQPDRHEEYMRLYMAAQPPLRAYVLSAVRDLHATDDILQEVAVAAWRQFGSYEPSRPFVAWVVSIARNKCVDFLRQKKAMPLIPEDVLDQLARDAAALSEEASERRKALARCLERLSEGVLGIVQLRFWESLAVGEIARRERKSFEAVRKTLTRARAFLVRCTGQAMGMGAG